MFIKKESRALLLPLLFPLILASTSVNGFGQDAVDVAANQIGKTYVWGAAGPDSFDCSGLTKYSFQQVLISLPRTALEQSQIGRAVTGMVERGDLLFFETDDSRPGAVTHVGVYEGANEMIDANSYSGTVTRDDITTSYWSTRFLFARRLSQLSNQPPKAGFLISSGNQSAMEGQTLNLTVPLGATANVSFSASRSSDPDGTVVGWEWRINGTLVSGAASFNFALGVGTHLVSLIVTDNLGSKSSPVQGTIVVTAASVQPPTCTLAANPSSVYQGRSSTLSWTTTNNPTTASIDNNFGPVNPAGGSTNVSPTATITYTLTVSNLGGSNPCFAQVTVFPALSLVLYDDFQATQIDSSRWSPSSTVITSSFVRAIQNGELVLKNQAPLTGFLENGVFMTQLAGLRAIQADIRLTEWEAPPAGATNTNSARLLFALYNDGTAGGGVAGDVIADLNLGVGPGSSQVATGFQIFRCANPSCSSASFLQGFFGVTADPNTTHVLSIAWDGAASVRFGFDGAVQTLNPTQLGVVSRAPISGYTGLTVVGVSRAAAAFDNVFVAR